MRDDMRLPIPSTFRNGVERKAFLKVVAYATAAISLSSTLAAKVVEAVEKGVRPSVIWLHFQVCTRCTGGLYHQPETLNSNTKNLIKLYVAADGHERSFMKQQCMHYVNPACVSGCPMGVLHKEPLGVVGWKSFPERREQYA